MIICKDFDKNKTIKSIDGWKNMCPPEGGERQWKDGRSAKEWIKNKGKYLETLLDNMKILKELISQWHPLNMKANLMNIVEKGDNMIY